MDKQINSAVGSSNAWLVITVKDGKLAVNANLPLRWMLILVSAMATVTGYSSIVELIGRLFHIR